MTTKNRLDDSGVSRRDILRLGAGGMGFSLFGGVGPVPEVLGQASRAAAANTSGKILVVFEWFGGNDGLNTIVPYGDAMYYKHRPTIGIKEKDTLKIDAGHRSVLRVTLRYGQEGERVIRGIDRVSSPGRRVYRGAGDTGSYQAGQGIFVLSTDRGVISDREARQKNAGGEVLCRVW